MSLKCGKKNIKGPGGRLLLRHPSGNSTIYQFQIPAPLIEYVVPKGSIAMRWYASVTSAWD